MASDLASTSVVSDQNAAFWNELCGTQFAASLGVEDDKPASLKKFDDWYFAFYPYLFVHIPFEDMKGKDVLEVGLGYGTVAQRLAETGARYNGLDIAAGPVGMVNHRLRQAGLEGKAQQGSILSAPFADQSFDYVVAIGCLHHTGDLKKAIAECHRMLRPGGKLVFMVYYSYSYRRFFQARRETVSYFFRELIGHRGVVGTSAEVERAAYDTNAAGEGAPHTDWISIKSLRSFCRNYSAFSAQPENIDNGTPFGNSAPRRELLKTWYPRWFGLDLYATATK
jgi:SAM-dependent methyltransferase